MLVLKQRVFLLVIFLMQNPAKPNPMRENVQLITELKFIVSSLESTFGNTFNKKYIQHKTLNNSKQPEQTCTKNKYS